MVHHHVVSAPTRLLMRLNCVSLQTKHVVVELSGSQTGAWVTTLSVVGSDFLNSLEHSRMWWIHSLLSLGVAAYTTKDLAPAWKAPNCVAFVYQKELLSICFHLPWFAIHFVDLCLRSPATLLLKPPLMEWCAVGYTYCMWWNWLT